MSFWVKTMAMESSFFAFFTESMNPLIFMSLEKLAYEVNDSEH
jgi:hypothetical protein